MTKRGTKVLPIYFALAGGSGALILGPGASSQEALAASLAEHKLPTTTSQGCP